MKMTILTLTLSSVLNTAIAGSKNSSIFLRTRRCFSYNLDANLVQATLLKSPCSVHQKICRQLLSSATNQLGCRSCNKINASSVRSFYVAPSLKNSVPPSSTRNGLGHRSFSYLNRIAKAKILEVSFVC